MIAERGGSCCRDCHGHWGRNSGCHRGWCCRDGSDRGGYVVGVARGVGVGLADGVETASGSSPHASSIPIAAATSNPMPTRFSRCRTRAAIAPLVITAAGHLNGDSFLVVDWPRAMVFPTPKTTQRWTSRPYGDAALHRAALKPGFDQSPWL